MVLTLHVQILHFKLLLKYARITTLSNGDVAELVEGTSLLTRQGSNTLMSSNLIVSAIDS